MMRVFYKDPGQGWRIRETEDPLRLYGGTPSSESALTGVALLWEPGKAWNCVFFGELRTGRLTAAGWYRGEYGDVPYTRPEELLEDEKKYRARMRALRRRLRAYRPDKKKEA